MSESTDPLTTANRGSKCLSTVASGAVHIIEKAGRGVGRMGRGVSALGPAAGLVGDLVSLPSGIASTRKSLAGSDVSKAAGDVTSLGSVSTAVVKGAIDLPVAVVEGRARSAALSAFKQKAPGASKAVIDAAAKTAAEGALKSGTQAEVRAAAVAAAKKIANSGGTLAEGMGAANRIAAKKLLQKGGVAAARAATEAAAHGTMACLAKTGGRFVPGLNIAIATLDSANCVATLADKDASTAKKAASVITAAGSWCAASQVPLISQGGAIVSGISQIAGSFL